MPPRRGKARVRHSRSIIWAVIIVIAVIVGLALLYGPNLSEGIVTCEGNECLQAGHFHARVAMTICGVPYQFPLEGGLLSGQHTHKGQRRIHWHSTAPVGDNSQAFTIERMLSDFSIVLPKECNGEPIAIKVVVNGQSKPEGLQYSWNDGDSIVISIE
ncbi:MAG: hypothetical protein WAP74_04310 [Patescibacteria group bacterium]